MLPHYSHCTHWALANCPRIFQLFMKHYHASQPADALILMGLWCTERTSFSSHTVHKAYLTLNNLQEAASLCLLFHHIFYFYIYIFTFCPGQVRQLVSLWRSRGIAHSSSLPSSPDLGEIAHASRPRTRGVHSRWPMQAWVSHLANTHPCTHTCIFFIIIPELIGSNYLPWLWLVSL